MDMRTALGVLAGCFAFASLAAAQPTYSKDISRIFRAKCEQCHREGDIAPFALKDYEAAAGWAPDIKRVITDKLMPPWKPEPGYGEFQNNFSLTGEEKQAIFDWIDAGAPQGDPAEMPDPLEQKSEWPLGQPDLDLRMLQPYTPARGKDIYRCFVIPTGLDGTKFLSAIDVLPGNRQIVHHVLLYQDTQGVAEKLDGVDGQPGYDCFGGPGIELNLNTLNAALGGWAPGQRTHLLPDGIGIELTKGAKIIMQVHYFPQRGTGEDQTRIGLYFSKTKIEQHLFEIPVVNTSFKIPAGADAYEVTASLKTLPILSGQAIWVYPHMHLLGRQIKVEVVGPDKKTSPAIYIKDWNFNWQGAYTFVEPMKFAGGSTVKVTCTFDNSDQNPKNPNNPLVAVGWGENTTDEMCLAFIGVTLDIEKIIGVQQ